ncbi:MAG: hypothetical protein ACI9OJ_003157 [Myxococcota bacterium]|jgi:hypothetical protein
MEGLVGDAWRLVKGNRKTSMHENGKSDRPVVPAKRANKGTAAAEPCVEERGPGFGKDGTAKRVRDTESET